MGETNLYELIGRKQTDLDGLNAEYDRLLALLARVVSGEIAHERVVVDLSGRRWTLLAQESTPEGNGDQVMAIVPQAGEEEL